MRLAHGTGGRHCRAQFAACHRESDQLDAE
jgi:hypothetical protein